VSRRLFAIRAVGYLAGLWLLLAAVAWGLPLWVVPERTGPTSQELIDRAFEGAERRSYDCLIVGNSRLYRGLNPSWLGVDAFNFAHDADAYNQVYYKLRYLDDRDKSYRLLIVGVDYFGFSFMASSRNDAYAPYLGGDYLKDYETPLTVPRWFHTALRPVDEEAFNEFMTLTFTRPASRAMTRVLAAVKGDPDPPSPRMLLRDNGQFVVEDSVARDWDVLDRDATRLPLQVEYFRAAIRFAHDRGAQIVLLMPPVRDIERRNYESEVVREFDTWLAAEAASVDGVFLNYFDSETFAIEDFADVTHLNEAGADKFSRVVAAELGRLGFPGGGDAGRRQ